jgi:hypothetical protein
MRLPLPAAQLLFAPLLLAAPLFITACVSTPRLDHADAAARPFPLERFFVGRTEGEGMLTMMMGGRRKVRVSSLGRSEPDGAIALAQAIHEEGKPARTRIWRLREVAPGRYAGTLTDAKGAVRGKAIGNRLHLSFEVSGDMEVDQWLTLAPDGRSARNVLRVRKFGVVVAALDETIRKLD